MDELLKLLSLESELVTEMPAIIPFTTDNRSMLPEDVTIDQIKIYPLKVATVARITPLLAEISTSDLTKITVNRKRAFHPAAPKVFERYAEKIIEVVCLGIHNKSGPYPEYMPEFLKANCTWKDLHVILNAIMFRIGTLDFLESTTQLKKVGLITGTELIAMQKNMISHKERS